MSLNTKDLGNIKKLIEVVTEPKINQLEEKINSLPTKAEFLEAMDQIMGELKDIRIDRDILTHKNANHETRILKIEKHLKLA